MFPIFKFLSLELYTYPLMMGMIWAISYHLGQYLLETRKTTFKSYKLYFLGLFVSSWIGAKIFYLFTLELELVKLASASSNFWLGGGFVFYGGMIFGLFFTFFFSSITKQHIRNFTFAIPILCVGHALGRIGCLLAGCCYGTVTKFPLSIHMHGHDRHPVQLYESIGLFILFLISFEFYKRGRRVVVFYLGGYSLLRFGMEFLRGDQIRGENVLFIFSTSQVIAIVIFAIVVVNARFVRSA